MAKAKPETKAPVEIDTAPPSKAYDWRDPEATFADDDHSLDAELWRMAQRQEGRR